MSEFEGRDTTSSGQYCIGDAPGFDGVLGVFFVFLLADSVDVDDSLEFPAVVDIKI
ncbi:MAG: hypothetical protein SGI92_33270 [Bryobacteraceae bacterium]|nr:hypothetical protein [Bryobacteraceae bacterium]